MHTAFKRVRGHGLSVFAEEKETVLGATRQAAGRANNCPTQASLRFQTDELLGMLSAALFLKCALIRVERRPRRWGRARRTGLHILWGRDSGTARRRWRRRCSAFA